MIYLILVTRGWMKRNGNVVFTIPCYNLPNNKFLLSKLDQLPLLFCIVISSCSVPAEPRIVENWLGTDGGDERTGWRRMVINLSRPGFSPLSLWLLPRCWMNEELIGQHGAAAEPHWPPHASQTSTGDPQLWQYSDNVKTNTMHMLACNMFCHICH